MRKFKKSLDNGTGEGGENPEIGLNSPRLTRKNRGGSFSGYTFFVFDYKKYTL